MSSILHDLSAEHNQYPIDILNGRKTVSNNETCVFTGDFLQCALDLAFGS